MPEAADAYTWVTPVLAACAAIGTGLGAVWVRVSQAKRAPPDGPGIVAVGGTLTDGRALNANTDQLVETGRSLHHLSRTLVDMERTMNRIAALLEDRVRADREQDVGIRAALNRLKDEP